MCMFERDCEKIEQNGFQAFQSLSLPVTEMPKSVT